MRILFYILQKEFTQIFRNRSMLPIIFVMPLVQMLLKKISAGLKNAMDGNMIISWSNKENSSDYWIF